MPSLIPINTEAALQKATTQTLITNKLLTIGHNLMRQHVKEFLIKYADREVFTIDILSRSYPITEHLIEKYKGNWKGLSGNQFFP
jgi:hypothetical protein